MLLQYFVTLSLFSCLGSCILIQASSPPHKHVTSHEHPKEASQFDEASLDDWNERIEDYSADDEYTSGTSTFEEKKVTVEEMRKILFDAKVFFRKHYGRTILFKDLRYFQGQEQKFANAFFDSKYALDYVFQLQGNYTEQALEEMYVAKVLEQNGWTPEDLERETYHKKQGDESEHSHFSTVHGNHREDKTELFTFQPELGQSSRVISKETQSEDEEVDEEAWQGFFPYAYDLTNPGKKRQENINDKEDIHKSREGKEEDDEWEDFYPYAYDRTFKRH